MRKTSKQRAVELAPVVGRQVTVKVRQHDALAGSDIDRFDQYTGKVLCLARRVKGNSDWRGTQYDMVLHHVSGTIYTIAVTRIIELTSS